MLMFKRIFLIGLLVLIGLAALACIGAIVISGLRGRAFEATLVTAFLWGVLFVLALAAFAAIEQRRQLVLATIGLLGCATMALTTPVVVGVENYHRWLGVPYSIAQTLNQSLAIGYLFTAWLCISAVTLTPVFRFPYYFLPRVASLMALIATCIGTVAITFARNLNGTAEDFIVGLMLTTLVLAVSGIFATYILNKFLATTVLDPVSLPSHKLPITCPRCMKAQDLPMGESRCVQCKLKFKVDIEEPKCPTCGYVLHMLTRPICPECGTSFSADELSDDKIELRKWAQANDAQRPA